MDTPLLLAVRKGMLAERLRRFGMCLKAQKSLKASAKISQSQQLIKKNTPTTANASFLFAFRKETLAFPYQMPTKQLHT